MTFSTKFIALALLSLSLSFAATAGAHDTDHPVKKVPAATEKSTKAAMTCTELAEAKKSKTALVTPEMQATDKRCKAEADAKTAATKKAAGDKK